MFWTSGSRNVVVSDAKRKSHDTPISTPTPKQCACAARITGFSTSSISSNRS